MSIIHIRNVDVSTVPKTERFMIDANVLLYLHYLQKSNHQNIANIYSNFISGLSSNGNDLCVSCLTLQEIFYVIEKNEYEVYLVNNGLNRNAYKFKAFRRDKRGDYSSVANNCYSQMKQIYKFVDAEVCVTDIEQYTASIVTHQYDPIDYILVNKDKTFNYVSNDKDFQSDNNINLYIY